jgi:hypothetical protein
MVLAAFSRVIVDREFLGTIQSPSMNVCDQQRRPRRSTGQYENLTFRSGTYVSLPIYALVSTFS